MFEIDMVRFGVEISVMLNNYVVVIFFVDFGVVFDCECMIWIGSFDVMVVFWNGEYVCEDGIFFIVD